MDTRFTQQRRNRDGSLRVYWRRPGHKLVRLSDGIWPGQATKLNAQADRAEAGQVVALEHTVAWVVGRYRASERWAKFKPASRGIYERWLREIEDTFGPLPFKAMTARVIGEHLDGIARIGARNQALAVWNNLVWAARLAGSIHDRPTARLHVPGLRPRRAIWQPEDDAAFLAACEGEPDAAGLRMAFLLLVYTGQRPSDVRAMRRDAMQGDQIRVTQRKTGRTLLIPCHRTLRAALAGSDQLYLACRADGRPFSEQVYDVAQRRVRRRAGLKVQMRDLRRTAVVRMAEAGVDIKDIASVTGHKLSEVRSILEEVYWLGTAKQARRAIETWEGNDG